MEKIKSTRLNTFFTSDEFKTKMQLANVIPHFVISEYLGVKKHKYKFECTICHNIFYDDIDNSRFPRCLKCNPYQKSNAENELFEYIKSVYTGEIYQRDKKILNGKELDIYIPNKNIAIEFNWLLWHSELFGKKSKEYHLNKTLECEKLGIQLIHIFEDEWINKKEIIKAKLMYLLKLDIGKKIYARTCAIKEISSREKNNFLEKNHLQGADTSAIRLGLFFNGELVSVMTFGSLRRALGNILPLKDEYELIRFSSSKTINGAASKLLSHFIKNYKPTKIISYADRRWSIGNLYEKLGFKKISNGLSNYWYIDTKQHRFYRFGFRKNILHKKLKIFNSNLTEWENMQINGYDRIWDCGSLKYELVLN